MASRHFIRLDAETLARDSPLKIGRKESVLKAYEHAESGGTPAVEGARRREHALRLGRFTACPCRIDHRLGHIVKELDQRIKWCIRRTAFTDGLLAPGIALMRIGEPLAR